MPHVQPTATSPRFFAALSFAWHRIHGLRQGQFKSVVLFCMGPSYLCVHVCVLIPPVEDLMMVGVSPL